MTSRRLDCPLCQGDIWYEDAHGSLRKCPTCRPHRTVTPGDRPLESPDASSVRKAIEDRAKVVGEFTVPDVLEAAFGEDARFGNVVGAVTAQLARDGVICRVGYRSATRSSRAGGIVAIWTGQRDR